MGIKVLKLKNTEKMSAVNREFQTGGRMQSMKNVAGEDVDLYIPRKCSATSKVLNPNDKSSVQLNMPKVDASGRIVNGEYDSFLAISGYIRNKGRSDYEIEKILRSRGLYPIAD